MTFTGRANNQCRRQLEDAVLRLVLLRHAQAESHGRFCGHSNPPLSIEGQRSIPGIVQHFSSMPSCAIWSSDLRRAEQTAAPIGRHFGVTLRTSPNLREMNFGQWEGLSWKEVEAQFPQDALAWKESFPHHRPPGGESFDEFQGRVVTELERLAKEAEPHTLVVTHAGFIRTAVAWVLGMPDNQILRIGLDCAAATVLQKSESHWGVTALNAGKIAFEDSAMRRRDRT